MWIKICGVRDGEAARGAIAAGASAIGLNFFTGSPRAVNRETAREIVCAVADTAETVGVFVNDDAREIIATVRACGMRTVQLHGDEPPHVLGELQRALPDLKLIRAWGLGEGGLDPLAKLLDDLRASGVHLFACLIDARVDGLYGGTGRTARWDLLANGWPADWPRLILAGGLTPENVGEAIATVHPWGLDVASGVESAPGVKDSERVRRFVTAARSARLPARS